ncbi:MAG: hypothetical protein CVT48_01515 [Thermoplasmata archaeon HGW-Thermoplasmata-1]|nr:MAG: hypothetical protein CVT48_01515 [Thermoplasmata archaeon HGW-Thermoplasmata-1]
MAADDSARRLLVDEVNLGRVSGVEIPREITVADNKIELRKKVSELLRTHRDGDAGHEDAAKSARSLGATVKKAFDAAFHDLKTKEMPTQDARAHADLCLGLLKTLKVLQGISSNTAGHCGDREDRIEDTKRWLKWGKKVA